MEKYRTDAVPTGSCLSSLQACQNEKASHLKLTTLHFE